MRPELGGAKYVVVNLLVGVALALIALTVLGSSPEELGLSGNRLRVVAATGSAAVILVAPLFVLAAFEPSARFVADERVSGFQAVDVAFHSLIRIPLGTALFEEFVFRGVLFGLFSRRGDLLGAVASSVPFGLWHIRPTLELVDVNAPDAGAALAALLVFGAVLITTAAGLAFCWLRIKGRGIAAPVVFHSGVNSLALVAAAIAHRQLT